MATKTITFDGLPVEVTDAAEAVINKLKGMLDTAGKALETAKAEHATAIAAKDAELGAKDAKIAKNFIGNNSGLGEHVIWNFYEAQTIDFGSNSFYGSVLAPYAAGKIGNFIEGSAVFGSLEQNGEIHLGGYGGKLEVLRSAVPEPATWAMMIIGFGLIGSTIRRRNRVALAA